MTSSINPWNEIYRIAVERMKQAAQITTLRKQDGTLTTNLHGTLMHRLRNFTPEEIKMMILNTTSSSGH